MLFCDSESVTLSKVLFPFLQRFGWFLNFFEGRAMRHQRSSFAQFGWLCLLVSSAQFPTKCRTRSAYVDNNHFYYPIQRTLYAELSRSGDMRRIHFISRMHSSLNAVSVSSNWTKPKVKIYFSVLTIWCKK